MRKWLERLEDRGETLIELALTIAIVGICAVAIGAGMAASIKISDIHRKQAIASEYLHNYGEALQSPSVYQPCSGASTPDYSAAAIAAAGTPPDGGPWTV